MSWVNRYTQIPFVDRGRSFEGVDCWGLIWLVYRHEQGVDLPNYLPDYQSCNDHDWLGELIDGQRAAYWREVERPEPFDVALFAITCRRTGRRWPCHVGVIVDPETGEFLHAWKRAGVRRDLYQGSGARGAIWSPRFLGAHRPA